VATLRGSRPTPPEQREIALLQARVRQAGSETQTLRYELLGGLWIAALGLLFYMVQRSLSVADQVIGVLTALLVLGGFGAGPAWITALPLAAGFRVLQRRRLRRVLETIPPERLAEALFPLQHDPDWDTRKLVAPLLRQFRIPTELIPAAAPSGRGDEASPAET
jgi:hypothetical protein